MTSDHEHELDDIDWEDADADAGGGTQIEISTIPDGDTGTDKGTGYQTKKLNKTKRHSKRYRESDYAEVLQSCITLLSSRLDHAGRLYRWGSDQCLSAVLQSLLPPALLTSAASAQSSSSSSSSSAACPSSLPHIERLFEWLVEEFKVVALEEMTEEEGRDGSAAEELQELLCMRKAGSGTQLTQLLLALLLSFGYRTRLVLALQLPSLAPEAAISIDSEPAPLLSWLEVAQPDPSSSSSSGAQSASAIAWSVLDVSSGQGDRDRDGKGKGLGRQTAARLAKMRGAVYVAAIEEVHREVHKGVHREVVYTDLTTTYITTAPRCPSQRLQHSFSSLKASFAQMLQTRSLLAPKAISLLDEEEKKEDAACIDLVSDDDEEEEEEAKEVDKLMPMPKALADFRYHPQYALERFLRADEALHPDKKKLLGMVKGEAVYARSSVEQLKSSRQWRRAMRTVLADQQPVPVRCSKRRRMRGSEDGEGQRHGEVVESRLYGIWQTEPLLVPGVQDGVLPRNRYGNWEVWDGLRQFVPAGAAYVADRRAARAASSIGLQHVPAVTGFEHRGGSAYPSIGGVLVLREQEGVLRDTLFMLEGISSEGAYHKQDRAIASRWEHLVASLLSRQRLKFTYGH